MFKSILLSNKKGKIVMASMSLIYQGWSTITSTTRKTNEVTLRQYRVCVRRQEGRIGSASAEMLSGILCVATF